VDREIGCDLKDIRVEIETLPRNLGQVPGEPTEDVIVDVGRNDPHPLRDVERVGIAVDDDDHLIAERGGIDNATMSRPAGRDWTQEWKQEE
jgi:hypothetical protein